MLDVKKKVMKVLDRIVPAGRVSYTAPKDTLQSRPKGGIPKKLKWKNAPKYKMPKTPKVSGKGWGY